jgi:hypothetical protein
VDKYCLNVDPDPIPNFTLVVQSATVIIFLPFAPNIINFSILDGSLKIFVEKAEFRFIFGRNRYGTAPAALDVIPILLK